VFGWATVIKQVTSVRTLPPLADFPGSLFYMPGTIGGAFVVDYLGPKYTMVRLFPTGHP